MNDPLLVLEPGRLISPASHYPLAENRGARLIRTTKPGGIEWLRDMLPYQFLKVPYALPITSLQTYEHGSWQTWMVDEAAHWIMTLSAAEKIKGPKVCVAGLGLGLIAHALATRTDITHVVIVERNPSVIELMRPLLPQTKVPRFITYQDDFWKFVRYWGQGDFQTFFVDLWRGSIHDHREEVLAKRHLLESKHPWPGTESLFFAFQTLIDFARLEEGLTHA